MDKMSVIVVAAGRSERFGGNESKVFAKIDGQPLFLRAVQLFVNREDVCQTILIVSPAEMEQFKQRFGANLGFMGVRVAAGGAQRCDSVAAGLALVSDEAAYVAVHDAVRVCVAAEWIDAVFAAAQETGAALPVLPVADTLKRLNKDRQIIETVSRQGLYQAQTPQVFKKSVLVEAYAKWQSSPNADITDDAQLVAESGHPVVAVEGDARNIKITRHGDLSLAAALLKTLPQKAVSRSGAFDEARW